MLKVESAPGGISGKWLGFGQQFWQSRFSLEIVFGESQQPILIIANSQNWHKISGTGGGGEGLVPTHLPSIGQAAGNGTAPSPPTPRGRTASFPSPRPSGPPRAGSSAARLAAGVHRGGRCGPAGRAFDLGLAESVGAVGCSDSKASAGFRCATRPLELP